jgi:hypothetical protein
VLMKMGTMRVARKPFESPTRIVMEAFSGRVGVSLRRPEAASRLRPRGSPSGGPFNRRLSTGSDISASDGSLNLCRNHRRFGADFEAVGSYLQGEGLFR